MQTPPRQFQLAPDVAKNFLMGNSTGGSVLQMFKERTLSVHVHNKPAGTSGNTSGRRGVFGDSRGTNSSHYSNPWEVNLILNEVPVLFKIDTGADVSAIPKSVFHQLQGTSLISSNHCLSGPSQYKLKVRGQFTGTIMNCDSGS